MSSLNLRSCIKENDCLWDVSKMVAPQIVLVYLFHGGDYLILYNFNLILGVFSYFALDVIHKKFKSLCNFFKSLWTWLRPSTFLSQASFHGLSAIGVLKHNDVVLQGCWLICLCSLLLLNCSRLSIEYNGSQEFWQYCLA